MIYTGTVSYGVKVVALASTWVIEFSTITNDWSQTEKT